MGPFTDGWTEAEVEYVLQRGDPAELRYVPIVVGMGAADVDPQWAEDICLGLVGHPDETVRGNAVLGFGHIARTCRRLEVARVAPRIRAALADPSEYVRGQAEAAAGDLKVFLGVDVRRAGALT